MPHLSFAVCLHQFAEGGVPFDFKLDHRSILTCHFQIDVVIFSLHALLK